MTKTSEIILSSFFRIFEKKWLLLKGLTVPFALYILLGCLALDKVTILGFLTSQLEALLFTIIAVVVHRIVLLKEEEVFTSFIFIPFSAVFWYAMYGIGIWLVILPVLLLTIIPLIGTPLAIVAGVYLVCRISLALPAKAVQDWCSFRDSWEITKKYQILMFSVVIVFPMISYILIHVSVLLPASRFFERLFSAVGVVFTTAALSEVYKYISNHDRQTFR